MRPKYVKREEIDAVPVIAPLPGSLLERCIVTPGLLAQIVVSKYCDHLPLYRQESIYWSRHEVWLPRQTMAEWMGLAADWLKPIYRQIREEVLEGGYVQIDETPIRYLEPGHGKTKLGYLWTYGEPRADVVFHWETSRAAACLENILPVDFQRHRCNATATRPMAASPRSRGGESCSRAAWPMCGASFTRPREQAPRWQAGSCGKCNTFTRSNPNSRETRAGPNLRASDARQPEPDGHGAAASCLGSIKDSHRFLPRSLMGAAIDYALEPVAHPAGLPG